MNLFDGSPWGEGRTGETYEQAALREVREETGLTDFEIDTSGFEEFEKASVTGHRW